MTGAQAKWLSKHREYRAVGQRGGHTQYVRVGILYPDGTFELIERGQRPRIVEGCFEVGVLENKEPGR